MFHTYIDWTNDGRPFYVGMGDDARIARKLGRNKHHTHVAKKHGQCREIVLSIDDRQATVDLEIRLIAEHHTFVDDTSYNGIGCNYTKGGEGCPCNEETRRKISESIRRGFENGRVNWNKGKKVSYNLTDEERHRRREQRIAFNKTRPNLGKYHSEEAKAKMRKPHVCSICKTAGHTKTTCLDRPADAINVVAIAQQQRHNREQNQKFHG